jgi:hypothetical protein
MCVKKWEMSTTRYAQTWTFLIHFLPRTIGSVTSGNAEIKNSIDININVRTKLKKAYMRRLPAIVAALSF